MLLLLLVVRVNFYALLSSMLHVRIINALKFLEINFGVLLLLLIRGSHWIQIGYGWLLAARKMVNVLGLFELASGRRGKDW